MWTEVVGLLYIGFVFGMAVGFYIGNAMQGVDTFS